MSIAIFLYLYGLYPSNQISPYANPELFQAARNTLLQRGIKLPAGVSVGKSISGHVCRMKSCLPDYQKHDSVTASDNLAKEYPEGRTYPAYV